MATLEQAKRSEILRDFIKEDIEHNSHLTDLVLIFERLERIEAGLEISEARFITYEPDIFELAIAGIDKWIGEAQEAIRPYQEEDLKNLLIQAQATHVLEIIEQADEYIAEVVEKVSRKLQEIALFRVGYKEIGKTRSDALSLFAEEFPVIKPLVEIFAAVERAHRKAFQTSGSFSKNDRDEIELMHDGMKLALKNAEEALEKFFEPELRQLIVQAGGQVVYVILEGCQNYLQRVTEQVEVWKKVVIEDKERIEKTGNGHDILMNNLGYRTDVDPLGENT